MGHDVTFVSTAAEIACTCGVTDRTIKRDALYASAIDALDSQERHEILAGKSYRTKADIVCEYKQNNGLAKPRPEKQFEKLFRTHTRKSLEMLDYHLTIGNREIQKEILNELNLFVSNWNDRLMK